MSDPLTTARAAWGDDMPDWVERLAVECQRSSQNKVAVRLKRSAGLISQVLRNAYGADTGLIEEQVRGAFMAETVECPALGTLPRHECQDWRRKAAHFSNANRLRVQMYRACGRCPLNRRSKS